MVVVMPQTNDPIVEHSGNFFLERVSFCAILYHAKDAVLVNYLCCFTHLSDQVQYSLSQLLLGYLTFLGLLTIAIGHDIVKGLGINCKFTGFENTFFSDAMGYVC